MTALPEDLGTLLHYSRSLLRLNRKIRTWQPSVCHQAGAVAIQRLRFVEDAKRLLRDYAAGLGVITERLGEIVAARKSGTVSCAGVNAASAHKLTLMLAEQTVAILAKARPLTVEGADRVAEMVTLLPCDDREWNALEGELEREVFLVAEARGKSGEGAVEGMGWPDALEKAEEIRLAGAGFTSYRKMAKAIGCTPSVLHDAIKNHGTVELQKWASKQRGASRKNAAPEVAAVAFEKTPQGREPDPAEVLHDCDVDVVLAKLLDQVSPDERARIHGMTPAEKRQLAETLYRDPDAE